MSLQPSAASYIHIHYALKTRKKQWQTQLYTNREVFSGSSLLRDLSFQPVSGQYKNFTRMSPTEFEFLINLIGEQISRKDTTFWKIDTDATFFGKWSFLRYGRKELLWEASFGCAFL
jgi:hypothetical protein